MTDKSKTNPQKHVLVVDDNVDLAQTYQELLQAFNYRATTANNGVRALKFIMENEVDAIVCDLSMPQLEGDKFYETAIRVRPKLDGRFIFVTGNVGNPKYEPFLAKVKATVLYKPVAIDSLMGALAELFAAAPGK